MGRKLRSGTTAAKLKYCIPIKPFDRNVAVPGHMEADTVAHCGGSLSGEFVWSLTAVDRLLGWTECRAVWNKLAKDVVEATQDIEDALPFIVKGLSTDNGGEFLNHLLISRLGPNKKRKTDIFMTRGRPYKKNDQCYVEQKNYTHVRKLLGYDRLDCPDVKDLINDLYRKEWSQFQNFFIPQVKLISKIRVGGRYKRKHSEPITPYERLMQCKHITDENKEKMRKVFDILNPFELRERIEQKLKVIWDTQRSFEQTRNRRSVVALPLGNIPR